MSYTVTDSHSKARSDVLSSYRIYRRTGRMSPIDAITFVQNNAANVVAHLLDGDASLAASYELRRWRCAHRMLTGHLDRLTRTTARQSSC